VWRLQAQGCDEEALALLVEQWPWGPKRNAKIDQENRVALRLLRRLGFATNDPAAWRALPDPLVIYRAEDEPGGCCWTTSRAYAEHFAKEVMRANVTTREIRKADALAFINGAESEVIVEPET
jgi:hypothetical protein